MPTLCASGPDRGANPPGSPGPLGGANLTGGSGPRAARQGNKSPGSESPGFASTGPGGFVFPLTLQDNPRFRTATDVQ